jgi:hypothetical protein
MHQSVRSRLEVLERRAHSAKAIDAIRISFVSPGPTGPVRRDPIAMREMRGEWRLERDPGEEVEAFRKRASKLCPRSSGGVPVLVEVVE